MKYTLVNNNPNNFKVTYVIDGQEQRAQLSNVADTYVRISRRVIIQVNPYGRIFGDGHEITQHTMTEEELFQESTVDALAIQKQYAGLLLEAFYNNGNEMTEELLELILNPTPLAKTKKSKKS
ncbi:hypothetical protein [Enterobacter kobei]|uniref:hypothetical protein n=1 Tax=Enterobacter kobei TaxID=208224 RepID=UPI0032AF5D13